MEAIMGALNFSPWTFMFQVINLLLVIAVLYLIVYKPVTKMVETREQRIQNALEGAAKAQAEAETTLAEYRAQLESARQEAQEMVSRAAKTAEEMREEAVRNARLEAEKILTRAREEIQAETARAVAELREQAATLAVLAAGRVLERELRREDHERLVREFIQEVGELQ
ncbi:MAG: F0F1 ATP synthase subunit B [Clostridia bacterium]|nr:F0F1 ATP synthase subunit B [Clostridia bacterium]MDH7572008.1 F0F1 ATP synthase subunit B [Clostridia bacterium]